MDGGKWERNNGLGYSERLKVMINSSVDPVGLDYNSGANQK